MSWTADDIETLRAAIATGAKRVRFQTHETEFRSLTDMLALLERMEANVNPSRAQVRRTVAVYRRGTHD